MVKPTLSRVLDACSAQLQCPAAAHPSFLVLGTVPSKEASLLVQVFVPRTCHSAADHRGRGVMGTKAACLPRFPGDSFHASLTCLGQPRKTLQASSKPNFCDFFFQILFIYGCAGSSLLPAGFLQLWRAQILSSCSVRVSHCSGFSYCRAQALGHAGFSSCGFQAQLLCSMWDLPKPGIKPMSPELAGGFFTAVPLGSPSVFKHVIHH